MINNKKLIKIEVEVEFDNNLIENFLLELKLRSDRCLVLKLDNDNLVKIFKNKKGEFSSISFFDKNKTAYLKSKKFRIITKNY